MSDLIHCIYASAATPAFDRSQIAPLLRGARDNNDRRALTGMLLYVEGSFLQVLEGNESVIKTLYQRLELDPRHTGVTKLIEEPIAERQFDSWTMGYSEVTRSDLMRIDGSNDFFGQAGCFDAIGPGRAKKILGAFRDGDWRMTT